MCSSVLPIDAGEDVVDISKTPDGPMTDSARQSSNWFESLGAPIIVILLGGGLRLLWIAYTNFTQEDAFITFRFAQQIARGNGFVYNLGEHIYGTTSPLFTLMLAAWLNLTGSEVIHGARGIGMIAALASLVIVWLTLKHLKYQPWQPVFVLATLAFSPRLWLFDTQGLETPLALLFLAASWWMFTRDQVVWAGALAGLMLWTRIDTGLWLVIMIGVSWFSGRMRDGFKLGLSAGLAYLPWVVFAWAYFGSPIPFTAIAKWVAYVSNDIIPLREHALIVFRALKPFFIDSALSPTGLLLSLATTSIGLWHGLKLRMTPSILALLIFALADAGRVTLTRATSFSHYAVPAMWAFLVLSGAGLGDLWNQRKALRPWARLGYPACLLVVLALGISQGVLAAHRTQDNQVFRHELALRAIGEWLNRNTSESATVLAEPLGYIGYYSQRYMFDEVGLVTPKIVELKRQGLAAPVYLEALQPDYYVMHCDDALRWLAGDEPDTDFFNEHYVWLATFNPIAFRPSQVYADPSYAVFARNACYDIWEYAAK